ncbi:clavesin-2-like [Leptidea sinapis]|uniref:clavesin-2-like n=1 Tax=Leptidea sinapis TaxID=189913 RepID=UPI00212A7F86|nr:clavesin-2-like [Leptidea sinapis]
MSLKVKPITIEEEYEKNPDITAEDVHTMRAWLDAQPHLPAHLITDVQLLIALHCCGRSGQVARRVLDLHFTLRTMFTSLFQERGLDRRISQALETVLATPLAERSRAGSAVMYCRLLNPDPARFVLSDAARLFFMVFDLWQYHEGTWPGFVIIIDMDSTCIGHIMRLDIATIRQILYFVQECMLVRLKEVHFINAPSFMDKLMMLLKPFLKKFLLDMIHIHQRDSDTFYQFVNKSALLKEDGGQYKGRDILREEQRRRIEDNLEYYAHENRQRVVEAARPGGQGSLPLPDHLFGTEGSFKKLDID